MDTDYDNYILLYTCQEAADFALKEQPEKLLGYVEAYQHHSKKYMHNVDTEHKHTRTSYEFKDTMHVRPIHKERVQILWRAGTPTVPHHVAVEGESDKQNQVWHKNPVEDLPLENMTQFMETFKQIPGIDEKFLELHYGPINQAGNSAVHEHDKKGHEETKHEPSAGVSQNLLEKKEHEAQDLKCDYDPYHMHNVDMGL